MQATRWLGLLVAAGALATPPSAKAQVHENLWQCLAGVQELYNIDAGRCEDNYTDCLKDAQRTYDLEWRSYTVYCLNLDTTGGAGGDAIKAAYCALRRWSIPRSLAKQKAACKTERTDCHLIACEEELRNIENCHWLWGEYGVYEELGL